MNSDLRRFAVFFAQALLIVLATDYILGKGLGTLYGKMKSGERARANFVIYKSKADVFVMGASTAFYHYNPAILQDSLHLSVYNAGRSAQGILYDLLIFKMILKRYKPKMIILDLSENQLVYSSERYELLNSLLPYYLEDDEVRKTIDLIRPGYKYFSWSHILPYNSSILAILGRSLTSAEERKEINGYVSLRGHKNLKAGDYNCGTAVNFDERLVDALHQFVDLCRENNIRLLTVTSPHFVKVECQREDFKKLTQELAALKVDHLDFSQNKKYMKNLDFMYDEFHMNTEGSAEFTKEVASYIKKRATR